MSVAEIISAIAAYIGICAFFIRLVVRAGKPKRRRG